MDLNQIILAGEVAWSKLSVPNGMPFGSIVVNGYGAIATSPRVQALKKVLFPEDGFPTNPTNIISPQQAF